MHGNEIIYFPFFIIICSALVPKPIFDLERNYQLEVRKNRNMLPNYSTVSVRLVVLEQMSFQIIVDGSCHATTVYLCDAGKNRGSSAGCVW